MRSAFFNCSVQGQPFPVVSNTGIKSVLDVRMPDPTLSVFLPDLPVFPKELLDGSKSVVTALQEKGMLKDTTFADVLQELRKRPLSEKEMTACLQWWIDRSESQQDPEEDDDDRRGFLGAAVLVVGSSDNGDGREIRLERIQTFLDPRNIVVLTDGPLPDHLLPINVNRELDPTHLQQHLQWRELTVLEWVRHIVDPVVYTQKSEFNIVESQAWAGRVLQVLGRCWPTLSEDDQSAIVGLLEDLSCIPTSAGMKTPSEAYFSEADIFHDLPVVDLPSRVRIEGSLEEVLVDLGVRKRLDLQVVIDR